MSVASHQHPPGTCDRCGRFDAVEIGDRWLCPDCIATSGSCCQESELADDEDGAAHRTVAAPFIAGCSRVKP